MTLISVDIITDMCESQCTRLAVVPPGFTLYRLDDCLGLCMFVYVVSISWYFVLFGL